MLLVLYHLLGNNLQFLHIVPLMINWRTDKMTVPASVGLYSTGWGFLCPQKSLYEDFVAVEGKDGYRLNATMKTFEQVQEMGCSVNTAIINEGIRTKEDLIMFKKFWPSFIAKIINKFYSKSEKNNNIK